MFYDLWFMKNVVFTRFKHLYLEVPILPFTVEVDPETDWGGGGGRAAESNNNVLS